MKRHQMRYYLRMREIEVLQYQRVIGDDAKAFSSPRIDSSWSYAGILYEQQQAAEYRLVVDPGPRMSYRFVWFYPHVFLPHLISFLAGVVLFLAPVPKV